MHGFESRYFRDLTVAEGALTESFPFEMELCMNRGRNQGYGKR